MHKKTVLLLLATIACSCVFSQNIFPATGNVGIGTSKPNAPLQFVNFLSLHAGGSGSSNRKIVLWEAVNNNHQFRGFGINDKGLRYQTDNANSDHVFYSAINATSSKELMRLKGTGNVGIGVSNPTFKLHLGSNNSGLRIEGPAASGSGGSALSIGGSGDITVDAPGITGGRFVIKENGNVGIGNSNPTTPLSFPPVLGKKITLYPGKTGSVGLGVSGNRLEIYSDNPNADVAIGFDAAGDFQEKFAFKPNGALAVNTSTGLPGQVLTSNGPDAPAQWQSPANLSIHNSVTKVLTGVGDHNGDSYGPGPGQTLEFPELSFSFTNHTNALALINIHASWEEIECAFCNLKGLQINLAIDDHIVFSKDGLGGRGGEMSEKTYTVIEPGTHVMKMQFKNNGTSAFIIWNNKGNPPGINNTNMSVTLISGD